MSADEKLVTERHGCRTRPGRYPAVLGGYPGAVGERADGTESGIGSVLPDGMRTAQLHYVSRPDADHMGLWWEFVHERAGTWTLADYRFAARLLGQLAARRRAGAQINDALPAVGHNAHNGGSALRFYASRRVFGGMLPVLQSGQVWQHPVLQEALRLVGDRQLPADMVALGARLPQVLDMLDDLPQTYAHGDASPQNLLLPAGEPETIVVIDWGFGTLLPVGFDLGQLLVGLAHAGQTDPAAISAIDAEIFPAYLAGLAAEDYKVDPAKVRAGYLGSLAARSALLGAGRHQDGEPAGDWRLFKVTIARAQVRAQSCGSTPSVLR
jgi:hypothetical protein